MSANDKVFRETEECELCGNTITKEWTPGWGGWQYESETLEVLDVLCCPNCAERLKPFVDAYELAEDELRRQMFKA